jgi:hypothetical protein
MPSPKTPTSPENLARIEAMFETLSPTMANLAERWADEHEYENIEEYRAVIFAKLPAGFTIGRMTRRPFGFVFTIGTDAEYRYTATARGVHQWKRIA